MPLRLAGAGFGCGGAGRRVAHQDSPKVPASTVRMKTSEAQVGTWYTSVSSNLAPTPARMIPSPVCR